MQAKWAGQARTLVCAEQVASPPACARAFVAFALVAEQAYKSHDRVEVSGADVYRPSRRAWMRRARSEEAPGEWRDSRTDIDPKLLWSERTHRGKRECGGTRGGIFVGPLEGGALDGVCVDGGEAADHGVGRVKPEALE